MQVLFKGSTNLPALAYVKCMKIVCIVNMFFMCIKLTTECGQKMLSLFQGYKRLPQKMRLKHPYFLHIKKVKVLHVNSKKFAIILRRGQEEDKKQK